MADTRFKKGQIPWNKKAPLEKVCPTCNKVFYVKPSLACVVCCSRSCARKGQSSPMKGKKASKKTREKQRQAKLGIVGPAHPLWKGGRDDRHDEMRRDPYKKWRMTVFQRDNFTCQDCGVMGVPLNAHHIKSWKGFPESRYDIDNGVTLCLPCHYKMHTKR
jgi:hypothetical protein